MRKKHEGRWTVPRKSAYNDPMAFERAMREALQTRSATEIGAELGVGQSTVSRWGSGALLPELWRVDAIAQVLNVSSGEVETMIVEAKRSRSRPQLEQRVATLETEVRELKAMVVDLAELRRSTPR